MKKKIKVLALVMAIAVMFTAVPVFAETRDADVKTASKNCTMIGVKGSYEYVSKDTILKRINAIRKEACNEGVINPDSGKKLKSSDYKPMKWSTALDSAAMLRAAEAVVNEDHTRPNGELCFTVQYKGKTCSHGENLAWNYSGIMQGIEQWYGEKTYWVKQDKSQVTGHYTSLISPSFTYIGVDGFTRSSGGWESVAAEFSYEEPEGGAAQVLSKKLSTTQKMEVQSKNLAEPKINGNATVKVKKNAQYSVIRVISFPGIMGGTNKTNGVYLDSLKDWASSKKEVATITGKGKLTGKKAGKTTVSVKLANGKKLTKKVTVKK